MARTLPYSNPQLENSEGFVANDICAICLINFTNETIAVPRSCNHAFCTSCLQVWERNHKICPTDRKPFNKKSHITNHRIYKYYVNRLLPRQTVGDIICRICSIGDTGPTRRCTVCAMVVHENCLDNLNCPPQCKTNEFTGARMNHEFGRNFTGSGSPPAPGSTDEDNIIQVDSDSDIGGDTSSLHESDSNEFMESMESAALTDEDSHLDEEMLTYLTEDESQDDSLIWISDDE